MYEQLKILLELQEIDSEIDKLDSLKANEPAKLQVLESELSRYKENTETKHKDIEELQKMQREQQRQLALQQEKITKYKSQRAGVKTNKEYTALEVEINSLESDNSKIEENILNIMISLEKAEAELKLIQEEYKEQEQIFQKKKDTIITNIKKINHQIAILTKERTKFIKGINQSLMNKYENWRKRKKTAFVAVIEGQACGGCHLTLPPQLINEVRKKKEFLSCNSCGRILYWMEDETPDENQ